MFNYFLFFDLIIPGCMRGVSPLTKRNRMGKNLYKVLAAFECRFVPRRRVEEGSASLLLFFFCGKRKSKLKLFFPEYYMTPTTTGPLKMQNKSKAKLDKRITIQHTTELYIFWFLLLFYYYHYFYFTAS